MGILNRTEMGVLLDDIGLVDELNGWFDGLWSQTAPPEVNEMDEFVQWLDLQRHAAVDTLPKKSISSGAKKVRAHLANRDGMAVPVVAPKLIAALELEPIAPVSQVAPLVQLRQERPTPLAFVDIYEPGVVVSLIDRLVANGFIFGDFFKAARLHGCQRERQRDLYLAILPFCANHARSAFEGDTINRLLIVSGRFVQSTTALLTPQQAPLDAYLSHLILALSFDEPRELPSIAQLFTLTGLREAQQKHLITSLAASRMLVPAEETTAGSAQQYTLRKQFIWSRRFQLFSKAYRNWTQGLARSAADYAATQTKAAKALDNAASSTLIQPVEASSAKTSDIPATSAQRVEAWVHQQSETVTEAQDAISFLPDDFGEIFLPSEPLPRAATRIIRQAKNAASGETGEPVFSSPADRIDMVCLELAKILEKSTGFFNFKTIEAFALYLYAHLLAPLEY
jgi:hypothetical protein